MIDHWECFWQLFLALNILHHLRAHPREFDACRAIKKGEFQKKCPQFREQKSETFIFWRDKRFYFLFVVFWEVCIRTAIAHKIQILSTNPKPDLFLNSTAKRHWRQTLSYCIHLYRKPTTMNHSIQPQGKLFNGVRVKAEKTLFWVGGWVEGKGRFEATE